MKYIIFIGDGMADNPVKELNNKTPLQTANIKTVNSLAKNAEIGSVLTVPKGVTPGSDTAILSIFGYNPLKYYSGRSPLEAAGSGVALNSGDVSYRCNMVSLSCDENEYENKKMLSHSGGGVSGQECFVLMNYLLQDEEFMRLAQENNMSFYPTQSFRHIAVQKNADINGLVTSPPHDFLGEATGSILPHGCKAANGLTNMMKRANVVLQNHELNINRRTSGKLCANGIWFWAEGTAIELPSFEEKFAKKGIVISAVPLVRGIGALGGMQFCEVEGATGELDTNYEGKADACVNALKNGYDLAVLHIEAPDECTHNGDTKGKIQAIEWVSERAMQKLLTGLNSLGEDYRILFLSDHKTLTSTRGHDGDVVPYLLYDSRNCITGNAETYCENTGLCGPLLNDGYKLINKLIIT
jgi:2,3-bisphosphoglycerate-independent phosphoglycerate mutase